MDKISSLAKLYSTWISFIGAALVAAPVDWANFEWSTFDGKKAMAALIWFVIWSAGRLAAQPTTEQK